MRRLVITGELLLVAMFLFAGAAAHAESRADRIWEALMQKPAGRTFVQAHRGDHEEYPENSLRAFAEAIRVGADIIELDVRRTRDGALVIMHDPTVNRTTSGTGAVSNLTFAEIEALRLRGPGGAIMSDRVPTFQQALETARGRILVTVDLKVDRGEDAEAAIAAVHQAGMDHRVLYYADRMEFLDIAKREAPGALLLPLASDPQKIAPLLAHFGTQSVHLKPTYLTPELVDQLQRRGVRTIVNALHDKRTATDDLDQGYDALVGSGVTIIQTNRPTDLLAYLASHGRHVMVQ